MLLLPSLFSPLDEELQLLPGTASPYLQEAVLRLGTWLPFERVPGELAFFCQATVSVETARRWTEGAGAALVAAQTQELERLERAAPTPPAGPAVQQLSVDGAMVPLVGGEWAEVKTLALGTVGQRVTKEGETVAHTTELSYFSRLAEAQEFRRLALVATHAAGTETAGTVWAVNDGAEWVQGFIDFHRPDAVRILDFPHAAEHVSATAQAVLGVASSAARTWREEQLTELKEGDPDQVLAALGTLAAEPAATVEARATCDEVSAYLRKRREQIAYATFRQAGYPIGDGTVESANKLVVEARLQGSRGPACGCRWERSNVNPMVALRACACSDQWEPGWRVIAAGLRQQEGARRQTRRQTRRQERQPPVPPLSPDGVAAPPSPSPPPAPPAHPAREKLVVDGRPIEGHPWHRFRLRGSHAFPDRAKP